VIFTRPRTNGHFDGQSSRIRAGRRRSGCSTTVRSSSACSGQMPTLRPPTAESNNASVWGKNWVRGVQVQTKWRPTLMSGLCRPIVHATAWQLLGLHQSKRVVLAPSLFGMRWAVGGWSGSWKGGQSLETFCRSYMYKCAVFDIKPTYHYIFILVVQLPSPKISLRGQ